MSSTSCSGELDDERADASRLIGSLRLLVGAASLVYRDRTVFEYMVDQW
jgi:hypothetical protein